MEERRLEDNIAASHDQSMWEVPKYRADSGGCTPSVKWDEFDKVNKWYEWEKRVDEKLVKIAKDAKDKQDRMKKLFFSLGEENMWMQYIDGWTHPKGKESFGDFYINDMNKAADYAATQFGKKNWLDITVYTEIHSLAFTSDAKRLEKRNGFRRETSGVYLPLPDKPLGVFHDIQLNGKINYDVNLRKIDNSPAQNKNGPVGSTTVVIFNVGFTWARVKKKTRRLFNLTLMLLGNPSMKLRTLVPNSKQWFYSTTTSKTSTASWMETVAPTI